MTLKIGLIGCGGITQAHVEGWKTVTDRAQIVAVADVSAAAMQTRIAQIGHAVKTYTDYHDLLADPEVEAVDISLPHHLHREAVVAAAQAGKHLMTEKPLCLNLEEAADIAAAVQKAGITMMAAHNQIFFPAVMQAKQMVMNGDLGDAVALGRRPPEREIAADVFDGGLQVRTVPGAGTIALLQRPRQHARRPARS